MSGWVHRSETWHPAWAGVVPQPCTTPTPDPDSPCGKCHDEQHVGPDIDGHPHQPTRCTCGHPIEERA